MSAEPPLKLVDRDRARVDACALFESVHATLSGILPQDADIRHIGATAVPGCETKGDLDIVVRVALRDFESAESALASRYARNEGSLRTREFSAFEDPSCRPHLGIQLVAVGSALDVFHLFVEALQRAPEHVAAYNALKRRYEGADMASYRAAKDRFVEAVLAEAGSREE